MTMEKYTPSFYLCSVCVYLCQSPCNTQNTQTFLLWSSKYTKHNLTKVIRLFSFVDTKTETKQTINCLPLEQKGNTIHLCVWGNKVNRIKCMQWNKKYRVDTENKNSIYIYKSSISIRIENEKPCNGIRACEFFLLLCVFFWYFMSALSVVCLFWCRLFLIPFTIAMRWWSDLIWIYWFQQ